MCQPNDLGGAFLVGFIVCLCMVGCWVIATGFREALAMQKRRAPTKTSPTTVESKEDLP